MPALLDLAVHNNAAWCDAVCRAHGTPGEFHEHIWINPHAVPRFYPNAVTLTGGQGVGEQLAFVRNLMTTPGAGSLSVKDSYCTLDLAPLGFRVLFVATWLARQPVRGDHSSRPAGVEWRAVQEGVALTEWERVWSGAEADPALPPLFPPVLLADANIRFIGAYREGTIVAGCIASRTGEVAGMSNVFTPDDEAASFWDGCVTAVGRAFPGLPIVDYERGPALELARNAGFEPVGPLRVWHWDA